MSKKNSSKLSKKQRRSIAGKIEEDGFDSYFMNYQCCEDLAGTLVMPAIELYDLARKNLKIMLKHEGIEI
jgi:hypothetical protein